MPSHRTFSTPHIDRQRASHAAADGYGRHRHLYLHDTMRAFAKQLRTADGTAPTWLDYGCGKGGFIAQIEPMGMFGTIAGYDPAVRSYNRKPEGTFDLVTCLHVIDVVEPRFLDAVLDDIVACTDGVALFDVLTRPAGPTTLRPHPPEYWTALVGRRMRVLDTTVVFPEIDGFERAIITAARPA